MATLWRLSVVCLSVCVLLSVALAENAPITTNTTPNTNTTTTTTTTTFPLAGFLPPFLVSLLSLVQDQLSNRLLQGGLVLALSTSLLGACSMAMRWVWGRVLASVYCTVTISDPVQVGWVLQYLGAKHRVESNHNAVELKLLVKSSGTTSSSRGRGGTSVDHAALLAPDGPTSIPQFSPQPNSRIMWLKIKGRTVGVKLVREVLKSQSSYDGALPTLSIHVSCLGKSKKPAVDLLMEAYEHHQDGLKRFTSILRVQKMGTRHRFTPLPQRLSRRLDTVVLNGKESEKLLADMQEFLSLRSWYSARGLPYRRGYLLFGKPGCGKSSIVSALGGHLQLPICLVSSLADKTLTDSSLADLFSDAPSPSILLLEDVDAAVISARRDGPLEGAGAGAGAAGGGRGGGGGGGSGRSSMAAAMDGSAGGVTLSGLLNALDGVAACEGKIVILTTNHRDRLDDALIRPGRVDVQVEFGLASSDAARRLFLRFYATSPPNGGPPDPPTDDLTRLAQQFSDSIEDGLHSHARLVGYLMNYRTQPAAAAAACNSVSVASTSLALIGTPLPDGSASANDVAAGASSAPTDTVLTDSSRSGGGGSGGGGGGRESRQPRRRHGGHGSQLRPLVTPASPE